MEDKMSVIKFIIGFIRGSAGLLAGGIAGAFFLGPLAVVLDLVNDNNFLSGEVWVASFAVTAGGIYVGAGYTPRLWKWGLRLGALVPIGLATPYLLMEMQRLA